MIVWQAHLAIDYTRSAERVVAKFVHKGPLRLLQSLYPEGYEVCHNVLSIPQAVWSGAIVWIFVCTWVKTRAPCSPRQVPRGFTAANKVWLFRKSLHMLDGARLEWLPLESIAYNGCYGVNRCI